MTDIISLAAVVIPAGIAALRWQQIIGLGDSK